jgi:hypothetical protein
LLSFELLKYRLLEGITKSIEGLLYGDVVGLRVEPQIIRSNAHRSCCYRYSTLDEIHWDDRTHDISNGRTYAGFVAVGRPELQKQPAPSDPS